MGFGTAPAICCPAVCFLIYARNKVGNTVQYDQMHAQAAQAAHSSNTLLRTPAGAVNPYWHHNGY